MTFDSAEGKEVRFEIATPYFVNAETPFNVTCTLIDVDSAGIFDGQMMVVSRQTRNT